MINFSFVEPGWEADFAVEPDPIRLLNPIASHQSVMRTTLIGSLVSNIAFNHARKIPRVRVFEVGRVFVRDPATADGPLAVRGIRQPIRIAAAAFGPASADRWDQAERAADYFDVKGDLEALCAPLELRFERRQHPAFHPGRSARVLAGGAPAGWLGELHPRWLHKYDLPQAPALFELDADAIQQLRAPGYQPVSKFPSVRRDIAVEVDEGLPVQDLLDAMWGRKLPIVGAITVFDMYRGKGIGTGKKSLAFRVLLQDTQKTLTDPEVDAAVAGLLAVLEQEYGAKLRQ